MFDTYVTVVGTVLTRPEWRRTTKTGAVVANFRVASHPRRYDRDTENWVDAPSLRVRVNCWRRLAEGVCASIMVGDPVVVYGRIATRDWKTEQGEPRVSYEVEAVAVGHDLARGQGTFERKRLDTIATVVEDAAAEARVNGELAESVAALNATRLGGADGSSAGREDEEAFDDFADAEGFGPPEPAAPDAEAIAILRSAGLGPDEAAEDVDDAGESADDDDADSDDAAGGAARSGGPGRRRRGRTPVPA